MPERLSSGDACRRSLDCRSVLWLDEEFTFTRSQAKCVCFLWDAWEQHTPDIGAQTLLAEIDSSMSRLRDLFRSHKAFGTMIIAGASKGAYRIAGEPPVKIKTQNSHVRSPTNVPMLGGSG